MPSRLFSVIALLLGATLATGCASYERFRQITEEFEIPSQIYQADYNQTWQAVNEVMKRFDLAHQNIESGVIKTRWMGNTQEINFVEAFGSNDSVKAAKFKLVINVIKGFSSSQEVTKVTVWRRQLVEYDYLQGWKREPSDGIQERVILYRVARNIDIDNRLQKLEKARQQEALEQF